MCWQLTLHSIDLLSSYIILQYAGMYFFRMTVSDTPMGPPASLRMGPLACHLSLKIFNYCSVALVCHYYCIRCT